MARSPVLVVAGCAALIILGLVLASVSSLLGTVITLIGIVLLVAFLLFVFRFAWRGDQKRAWNPGSLRREYREEQEAKPK